MLIKGINKKGDAIPYSPFEALPTAVTRAAKAMNTLEMIYWVDKSTVEASAFRSSTPDKNGYWEAWAEGTVSVGRTKTKGPVFYVPKKHSFKIHYKSAKDEFGIPDIAMASPPVIDTIETNPSKMIGFTPANKPLAVVSGELKPVEEVAVDLVAKEEAAPAITDHKNQNKKQRYKSAQS